MPVTVERIEPRIYLSTYSGKITNEEIFEIIHQRQALADTFKDDSYVSIADLSGITSFPLDIASLRSIADDPRNIAYLLVGASLQLRVLVESTGQQVNIEFFRTLEEAVVRARALLAENDQG